MEDILNKTPYNLFLYNKRMELGFSEAKMARALKLTYTYYHLLENGYIKPSKKAIKKISEYFNIDYNDYLEGDLTYPEEIKSNKHYKVIDMFFNFLGLLPVRIVFIILSISLLTSWITFKSLDGKYEKHLREYYSAEVEEFRDNIVSYGKMNYSIINEFIYPDVAKIYKINDTSEVLAEISSTYNDEIILNFKVTYWSENYKYYLEVVDVIDGEIYYDFDCLDYNGNRINCYKVKYDDDNLLFLSEEANDEYFDMIINVEAGTENNDPEYYLKALINDTFYSDDTMKDERIDSIHEIVDQYYQEKDYVDKKDSLYSKLEMVSIIFGSIFIFLSLYSLIYGRGRKVEKEYTYSDKLLYLDIASNIKKKDIKFSPFIPEIVFQLFGILLIAIGVSRVIFLGELSNGYNTSNLQISQRLLSIQMIGIFILSFIKFDLFIDDKRVLRNVFLYPLVFFLVYYLETYLIIDIKSSSNLVLSFFNISFPNPFMSTACYFFIMFFLFYTPKVIKTRKKLLLFRLSSLIPISYIFVSFFIYYSDVIFGVELTNPWFKNFFQGQRISLSILAVIYLVSLFFLRLYYKKKYGEDNANRYFMGNRYLFTKNIMTSIIVIIIWIFELIFRENSILNKMGIGLNEFIIVLLPFILFYHPHKGKRNRTTDYLILFLFILSMLYAYLAAAAVVLMGLL